MLKTLTAPRIQNGFTLIEILIALAILSALLAVGVPEMQTYSQNTKLRQMAGSFAADVLTARAEAIRTNDRTVFVLTSSLPSADPTEATASVNGPNWFASVVPSTGTPRLIVSQIAAESSGSLVTITTSTIENSTITFNGLGVTDRAAIAAFRFGNTNMNPSCALNLPVRCLQVEVSAGGSTRICEPGRASNGAVSASDTRVCTVGG